MLSVSVITPMHNASHFVVESINAVLNQTFEHFEMIIVDDCSSDNSVEVVRAFTDLDSRIKVIELTRGVGAAAARNVAIDSAQGRYIAFLDCDDLWVEDKLEKQLLFMQENNVHFSFGAYEKIDEFGVHIGNIGVPAKVSYLDLLKTNVIGCLTAIYDTEFYGKIYMPENTKREDFALWLLLLRKGEKAYGMQQILAKYRVHSGQSSAKKLNMAAETWRLYRNIEQLSLVKACYYFLHYAARGFLRAKTPILARKIGVLD